MVDLGWRETRQSQVCGGLGDCGSYVLAGTPRGQSRRMRLLRELGGLVSEAASR